MTFAKVDLLIFQTVFLISFEPKQNHLSIFYFTIIALTKFQFCNKFSSWIWSINSLFRFVWLLWFNRPYARVTNFFFFYYQKICFEKLSENPEGQSLKRLGSGEIERPSPDWTWPTKSRWKDREIGCPWHQNRAGRVLQLRTLKFPIFSTWFGGSCSGLERWFSQPRRFRCCPLGFPDHFSRQFFWYPNKKNLSPLNAAY